ncbi:1,4-dihydroxy-2-naphthoate octaprenyltransferase [Roseospirillum parvum]|uniref:1,4-dihydroxy-2-naphthoate octaprenyltransferase n=1 Tax=Roseospirillum parvum TaxID=83401 RepID=A0A1G8FQ16_9PROT|nr:1,4-dihydroxy-2-naphthoate octaprenyltransferase [Roseospirillum parvum]SDH84177.1 1,4-dihydroxy-2-naphthoate octaprenyltransferase [Roseospirillum parvum]
MSVPKPSSAAAVWWQAIRPRTLALSVSPVIAGAALAVASAGTFRLDASLIAGLGAMAIQIGTNLHNDAADFLNGTDQPGRIGPPRVTEQGWLPAETVKRAAHVAFTLAALAGLFLATLGGWPILLVGLASVLAGYAYSAGPRPISRGPFGEVMVIGFFGLAAVGGTYWLNTGQLDAAALALGLIVGLPAAAVLLVNNTRDLDNDRAAGRRTLAILLGRQSAGQVYDALLGATFGGLLTLALLAPGTGGALLGLAALPAAAKAARAFREAGDGAAFNRCLGATARVQVVLTLALAAGLVIF